MSVYEIRSQVYHNHRCNDGGERSSFWSRLASKKYVKEPARCWQVFRNALQVSFMWRWLLAAPWHLCRLYIDRGAAHGTIRICCDENLPEWKFGVAPSWRCLIM